MRRNQPTILVVDDDENDRMFIGAAFAAIGVTTPHAVQGGEAAVAYLSGAGDFSDRTTHPYPDFIITDLKMSDGDGFLVLEYLQKHPLRAITPTVVLTGSQDNDDIRKAYWLGASAYHVKPSSPAALRHLIRTLHDYWLLCEVPELDGTGRQVASSGTHKLGKRFTQLTAISPAGPGVG